MPSFSLTAEVSEESADELAALLVERGAGGAEVQGGEVAPMPGAAPLAPGRARVVAWFGERAAAKEAALALDIDGEVREVADEDWGERWKAGLAPFTVGRVHIRPTWTEGAVPAGAVEVVLDPGMAFGTGTHPTTSLCLAALQTLLAAAPGAEVLDVGTGSGLLAIAAAKLGARRVVGTDIDPVALRVAEENAERNGVELELLLAPPGEVEGHFGIAVANILANTLLELAPELAARVAPGGALLLSGLLAGQEDEVRGAYAARGLRPDPALDASDREWRLVGLRAPDRP